MAAKNIMLKRCSIIIFTNLLITTGVFAASGGAENSPQITQVSCFDGEESYDSFDHLSPSEVANFLGWVRDPKSNTLCGGSYVDPSNIINTPKPKAMQDMPIDVKASKRAFFMQQGMSVIKGDVVLVQPGREITADCVTFFRDSNTNKILNSVLVGNVSFREYGGLIVSQQSNLDFVKDVHTSSNGFYRMLSSTPSGITNVWGRAKHAVRNAMGILKMKKATYSTCPPDATSWHLWSNKLTLDRDAGRGEASNAFLFFKKIPVFYTPYFSFPIDKRRKSGFLFPDVMYSKDSGLGFVVPYYFNLAPNYDATFTPSFFTKRGMLLSGLFNYLTPSSEGAINVDYIPHDRVFSKFRDNAHTSYSDSEGPALSALQKSSSNRGFLSLQNASRFNDYWKGSLNINHVTDDYFLQDFSTAITAINKDQLFNQVDLNYADDHWRFSSSLQGFQTLHPVGRTVADQYRRLPQVGLAANFPDGLGGFDYQFYSEVVNFTHRDNFYNLQPVVAGGRFSVTPGVSLPFNWLGAYVAPKIQLQATGYTLHDQAKDDASNNIVRVLPLISVDSGMMFSRDIKFFQKKYSQTLEPRLFYLFVPAKNQDDIPLFDTNLPALDSSQLFRANRFSGIDRIGDANQIVAAVTTRVLDYDGQEKLNASLGQAFVIHKHQVYVDGTPDPLRNENFSPLIGQTEYFVTNKIKARASAAWDPSYNRFNTANVNLQYNEGGERVLNFWYNYGLLGDSSAERKNADLSRIGASLGWRIWKNWNVLGNLDYNVSYKRAQNYIYGLEYDSCCWALRVVQSKTYIGPRIDDDYDTRTYIQFFLKGLGDFGLGKLSSNLPGSISDYNDKRVIGL